MIRDSIVASIPACHAGDRGSIPRRGVTFGILGFFLSVTEISGFLPGKDMLLQYVRSLIPYFSRCNSTDVILSWAPS
eukprot:CCRYP_009453-RA/>CCRYP_009453-RA protein AED:0.29 eAED:-0.60 QI:0/-1/0/1/-1/0/1/0/76